MALVKIGCLFVGKNPKGKAPLSGFISDEIKKLLTEHGTDKLVLDAGKKNCGRLVVFKNHSDKTNKTWYDLCLQTGEFPKEDETEEQPPEDGGDCPF